ncbi:hypothetical protein K458DRAFT_320302, partial [Lentithecium fluviatile CBS 122367]
PRRAKTKMSYPSKLDNTVGGSLSTWGKPLDCMVRECEDELCLDPAFTRANLKACGTASHSMDQPDDGQTSCQHQVQYLFEIEFKQEMRRQISDGEVREIHLTNLFLVRYGHITAENTPDLGEMCSSLRCKLDLFIV